MDAKKKRNNKKKKHQQQPQNQQQQPDSTPQDPSPASEDHATAASAASDPNPDGNLIPNSQEPPLLISDHHADESQIEEHLQNGTSLLEQQPPHTDHGGCQQKLVNLHDAVTKLEEDGDLRSQKVTTLEDGLSKMQHKIDSCVQNEFTLGDKISKMQNTVDMHSQNEVHLGRKFQMLQNENDLLARRQVSLEDKFERIDDMKYSWSLKEGSLNATITCLEEANRTLQMQVKALEQSTHNTDQENRKLIETLSVVESRIETLEAKSIQGSLSADAPKMMEETSEMIITEFADKRINQHVSHFMDPLNSMNEHDINKNGTAYNLSKSDINQERSLNISPPLVQTIQENSEILYPTAQTMQYQSTVPVATDSNNDTTITVDIDQVQKLELHLPNLSSETVHPLQDVEINNEEEMALNDEITEEALPLSDAPLIGAPFRLFSFMAKYVAGSDLVNQTGSKSGN